VDGVVALRAAQMSYLLAAIDWRNPQHTWRPQSAGLGLKTLSGAEKSHRKSLIS
jgi:hypothetical protein